MKVYENSNLNDLVLDEIGGKILETDWVKSTEIKKVFPNKLIVKIIEKKPFAIWENDGQFYLIEEDGTVINYPVKNNSSLFIITNKTPPSDLKSFFAVLDGNSYIKDKIISINKVSDRRFDIVLINYGKKIRVKLPEKNVLGVLDKIEKLDREKDLLKRNINEIDARNKEWIVR